MHRFPAPELPDRILGHLPPGIDRYRVDVGGPHVHVMERGEGRPVLMLHGNPTWGFLWRKVIAALDGLPFRCIAPDLVGLGLSDRVPFAAHTLENHAVWIENVVLELDLKDVILVVQDWGGPIGGLAFHGLRDRLGAVVVSNTVVGPPKDGFRPTSFHRFAQRPFWSDLAFKTFGFPLGVLHRVQGDPASMKGDTAWAYWWPLKQKALRDAPLALARMVPDGPDHPSVPALRKVHEVYAGWKGPAAIVWGDRDPILGRTLGFTERTLPHAEVWRTHAGHFLQEEVPGTYVEAILHVAAQEPA